MSKFFKSTNPMLKETALEKQANQHISTDYTGEVMSVSGAVNKTVMLFGIMMITAFPAYFMPSMFLIIVGAVGGLIAVIYASFKPQNSSIAAPVYAMFEGLFIGAITAIYAGAFEGIIYQAIGLTMGTMLAMLVLYKTGIITVTQKFRSGVIMATGGVIILYVMTWILSLFGQDVSYMHDGGMLAIGISLVVIAIAAMNLLLDFDSFEKGEQQRAPQYMEWIYAMGLMVTLVWLYVEFLRLLSMLNRD